MTRPKADEGKKSKPWYERKVAQIPLGLLMLFYLFTLLTFENFNWNLLWLTTPPALVMTSIFTATHDELRGAYLAQAMAAVALAPFLSLLLWVPANVANELGKHDAHVHTATIVAVEKPFFGSGRGGNRYVVTVRLPGREYTLDFAYIQNPGRVGETMRVCEWTGLLGYPTYTLWGC